MSSATQTFRPPKKQKLSRKRQIASVDSRLSAILAASDRFTADERRHWIDHMLDYRNCLKAAK